MLDSIISSTMTLSQFFICTAVSVLLGTGISAVNMYKNKSSSSFALTLALLPVAVQVVIMLVNGNIGAGVAVAGAFGLVRFRSVPGSAREISAIFIAMAIGLATGMGYIFLGIIFFAVCAVLTLLFAKIGLGERKSAERLLKITIPENLDYDGLFDDIFDEYTKSRELIKVKTVSMGTLYELQYRITLNESEVPKGFIDKIRCRNGNLNISCAKEITGDAL